MSDPMTASYVITLNMPRGERWRDVLEDRYVESVGYALSLPPNLITIVLKPEVGEELAADIADRVRSGLDSGTVTVKYQDGGAGL